MLKGLREPNALFGVNTFGIYIPNFIAFCTGVDALFGEVFCFASLIPAQVLALFCLFLNEEGFL